MEKYDIFTKLAFILTSLTFDQFHNYFSHERKDSAIYFVAGAPANLDSLDILKCIKLRGMTNIRSPSI